MTISLLNDKEVNNPNVAILQVLFFMVLCRGTGSDNITFYDEPYLPTTVIPLHYNLKLITHLENSSNFRYEGVVKIVLQVKKPTNHVVLHATNMKIELKKITLQAEFEHFQLVKVRFNKRWKYMILTFNKFLRKDKIFVLSIEFSRSMSENSLGGYFIRHYVDGMTSRKSWYSVSHFERNLIRSTIPSFDEPSLRATFNVTLGHHKSFRSYSNMNVQTILPNGNLPDYVWSVYETSPPMPTYLLAFSVNKFTCRFSQAATANPVRFRTCSLSGYFRETSFVAHTAPQLLAHLEEMLQVRLPMEKIDQLVVDDFPTAAMENLGLVIYGTQSILLSEDPQPGGPMSNAQTQALQVIAHEMAHMWFGNMMGIDQWSDIWLQEGLTGYFGALALDHLQPRLGRRVLLRNWVAAFMHEAQVGGMVLASKGAPSGSDTYMYQKATSLVAMLRSILGTAAFIDGLQMHLWQNTFTNSNPLDLLRAMQRASLRQDSLPVDHNVRVIMESWTKQSGYPLVTVSRRGVGLDLEQGPALNWSRSERWWIPLTYTTQGAGDFNYTRPKAWLTPHNPKIYLELPVPNDEWVVFNLQATGYYRVQYDDHSWQRLASALSDDFRSIHVLNRAQIVSDVLFLRNQNRISWGTAFNVLKYIVDEDEYEPLMAFVVGVTHGLWGLSPENSIAIAKWLGIAGKWYAEFITYTFDQFVLQQNSLSTLDVPD